MYIFLDAITFRYRDAATPVLDRLSLFVRSRAIAAVAGPAGAGKTTLLRYVGTPSDARGGVFLGSAHPRSECCSLGSGADGLAGKAPIARVGHVANAPRGTGTERVAVAPALQRGPAVADVREPLQEPRPKLTERPLSAPRVTEALRNLWDTVPMIEEPAKTRTGSEAQLARAMQAATIPIIETPQATAGARQLEPSGNQLPAVLRCSLIQGWTPSTSYVGAHGH